MAKTNKPLEGKTVTPKEEVNAMREQGVVVKEIKDTSEKVNDFFIEPDKKWPTLVCVKRKQGRLPDVLTGLFTNSKEAQKYIDAYLGS